MHCHIEENFLAAVSPNAYTAAMRMIPYRDTRVMRGGLCLLTTLSVVFLAWRTAPSHAPIAPLVDVAVYSESGARISSVFTNGYDTALSRDALLQPRTARGTCAGGRPSPLGDLLRSILTPAVVYAQHCGSTGCIGQHMTDDLIECCPGGGGVYRWFYVDPGVPSYFGYRIEGETCTSSGCPWQCREVRCSN